MTHPIDTSPEAIAALLDGVTPGPWTGHNMIHDEGRPMTPEEIGEYVCNSVKVGEPDRFLFISAKHDDGRDAEICHTGNGPRGAANTRFIAAARELVPALAAEIARLTDELESARREAGAMLAEQQAECSRGTNEMLLRHASRIARVIARAEKNEAERDEARAQMAAILSRLAEDMDNGWSYIAGNHVRALTPADATAALSRRDAAMRNEGRRQAAAECETKAALWAESVATTDLSYGGYKCRDAILATLEPDGGE